MSHMIYKMSLAHLSAERRRGLAGLFSWLNDGDDGISAFCWSSSKPLKWRVGQGFRCSPKKVQ